MDRFRGRSIGVVFQRLHLLSAISVLNNLLLAQRLARMTPDKKKAMNFLIVWVLLHRPIRSQQYLAKVRHNGRLLPVLLFTIPRL